MMSPVENLGRKISNVIKNFLFQMLVISQEQLRQKIPCMRESMTKTTEYNRIRHKNIS